MKLFLQLIALLITSNAFSQPKWQASIGPQINIPIGDFRGVKTGYGGGLEVAKLLNNTGAVTAAVGFNTFPTKNGVSLQSDLGFITTRIGYRSTCTLGRIYGAADLGIAFFTQDFTKTTGFSYSIGPGYLLKVGNNSFVDLGARFNFNSRKIDKKQFNWVAIRAAFGLNFGGKK
ncbi:MAG: hypothetical protein V4722_18680 [Bacteroidota bacterium]